MFTNFMQIGTFLKKISNTITQPAANSMSVCSSCALRNSLKDTLIPSNLSVILQNSSFDLHFFKLEDKAYLSSTSKYLVVNNLRGLRPVKDSLTRGPDEVGALNTGVV